MYFPCEHDHLMLPCVENGIDDGFPHASRAASDSDCDHGERVTPTSDFRSSEFSP